MFAIVSFSSLRGAKDQTVVLRASEHPFLRWDTCVTYGLADITSREKLQSLMDCGLAKMHTNDLAANLLALVLDGFFASPFTKKRVLDFVKLYRSARPASGI